MAPSSMVPSMPRLSTPERSAISSPMVASSSGVAIRSMAAKKPASIMATKALSMRQPRPYDPQPVEREQPPGHHGQQGDALDHIREIDRHAGLTRHRVGTVHDDG